MEIELEPTASIVNRLDTKTFGYMSNTDKKILSSEKYQNQINYTNSVGKIEPIEYPVPDTLDNKLFIE